MPLKLMNAHDLKEGTFIIVDGASCVVRSVEISKTGKHGASKCRIEAIGLLDDKKRVLIKPGDERMEVPMVEKRRGQVLNLLGEKASIMDVENYETMEVIISPEVKDTIKDGSQVEYWDIEGIKIIKRVVG
jgi:translation initiation factor 5A